MAEKKAFFLQEGLSVLLSFKSKQDKLKKNISDDLRLNHLLTMSAVLGFRDTWDYDYKGLWKMYESSDFTVYALSRRKIHEPGEVFEYSDTHGNLEKRRQPFHIIPITE